MPNIDMDMLMRNPDEIFKKFDSNGDGQMQLDEYMRGATEL